MTVTQCTSSSSMCYRAPKTNDRAAGGQPGGLDFEKLGELTTSQVQ